MSSLSDSNHLPIEYISLDTIPLALMILALFQFFLYIILDFDNKIYSFFLGSNPNPSSPVSKNQEIQPENKKKNYPKLSNKQDDDESICREEVEFVMKNLGLFSFPEHESQELQERFDCNDLSKLFDEKEPTEEEVKAAFDVFDENKDGFIDVKELQRLFCSLGLKEGLELENCKRIIRAFDEDGDERIDFCEFLKFMETSFC